VEGFVVDQIRAIDRDEQLIKAITSILALAAGLSDHPIRAPLADFDLIWQALSSQEQRRLLHQLVKSIDYNGVQSTLVLAPVGDVAFQVAEFGRQG
jgi:hypothetical protein